VSPDPIDGSVADAGGTGNSPPLLGPAKVRTPDSRHPIDKVWNEVEMTSANPVIVVAAYKTHEQAARALNELHSAGVDERKLSLTEHHSALQANEVNMDTPGDRIRYWGRVGALCGLVFGPAMFPLSGLEPILTAGSRTAKIVAALEGALIVGTVGIVGASFYGLGIADNDVAKKHIRQDSDEALLSFIGSNDAAIEVRRLLADTPYTSCDYQNTAL
jgi:hypothetical protein